MHIADVISLSEIWDWFKVYFWSNMTPPARSTGNQNKRRSPNITPGRSPYYPLSPDDESYTIFISIALYYVAVFIMVPAMKAYYWREKNVTITTDDLQEIIRVTKSTTKIYPRYLQIGKTTFGFLDICVDAWAIDKRNWKSSASSIWSTAETLERRSDYVSISHRAIHITLFCV